MPSVAVRLYSVFFKLLLRHRLQSKIQATSSSDYSGVSDAFGITSRPEETVVAANPTFTDGVATKDIHIDPLTSLSIRIFLPESSVKPATTRWSSDGVVGNGRISNGFDPLATGMYRGYSPKVENENNCDKKVLRKLPVILQFHGGAFVGGSNDSFANDFFCRRIAKVCDVIVVAVGYRLAPENRYPAAFEDGINVINWLGKQANLAECGRSMGTIRCGGGGGGVGSESRRSEMHRHIVDTFGASMVEPWLAAHCDPSRMSEYEENSLDVPPPAPVQGNAEEGWTIHSSIDSNLANRKERKAKSEDPGWKYSWWPNVNDKNTVQCLLCGHVSRGGIKRQKEHLIGGFGDVSKCAKATTKIRDEMIMWKNRGIKRKPESSQNVVSEGGSNTNVDEDIQILPSSAQKVTGASNTKSNGKKGPLDVLCRENLLNFVMERRESKRKQSIIEDHFKKQEKLVVDELFANAIYQNGLSFNIVRQLSIEVLCEAIGRYGRGYVPPSMHQVRKTLLDKSYEDVASLKNTYVAHWKKYGVTLMTDGWTDRRGRSLLNFLINCPEGTFFLNSVESSSEEKNADYLVDQIEKHMRLIGEENVIQICTDNASNYVLAGKKLMEKYPTLHWTPCAAHCLDLLLEDIGKLAKFKGVITTGRKITSYIYSHTRLHDFFLQHSNKKELVRCGVTRFATSFLTLQSLYDMKGILRAVFISDFWYESSWAKEAQGKYIAQAVVSTKFWNILEDCLRASQPIMRVLRLVDSDEKPVMGYISSALRKASQAIKENFGEKDDDYQPILHLMERRLEIHFRHPLYGAGAFLNPSVYYTEREDPYSANADLYEANFQDCVLKMIVDIVEQEEIMKSVEDYKHKRGRFGNPLALRAMTYTQPMNWWDTYGVNNPSLKRLAVRILGLTCTASNCERNWSTFEIIQTKRRSNLDPERLSKLVFIKYNRALHERFERRRLLNHNEDYDPISIDELNYSSEWMTGKAGPCNEFVYEEGGLTWAEVDDAMGASASMTVVRPRRNCTPTIPRTGARGRGHHSAQVVTYSRKGKEVIHEEEQEHLHEDDDDASLEFEEDFEMEESE